MLTGTLARIEGGSRFGFISRDDRGRDVFVHMSAMVSAGIVDPAPGMRLTFLIERDPAGREHAVEIKLLERAAPGNRYENRIMIPRRRT